MILARSRQKRRRRRSASLGANTDNPGENDEDSKDADTDGDTDDGIWSREFVVPTIVVTEPEAGPEMEMEDEDYTRGGGACDWCSFAIGTAV